ncbi:MAG TPA: polysaccharide biosynthesis/export family protein [Granulicella sp.]|nr:polysaccharide biosynthesis/export family protein [Granulicella sp.]
MPLSVCIIVSFAGNLLAQRGKGELALHPDLWAQPTPDTQAGSPKNEVSADYKIGNGDVLQISVWGEPQLTQRVTVRPDGNISLPLIHEVHLSGLNSTAAQALLNERFAQYILNPRATVIVLEVHSKLVYVMGRVQHPGAYPLAVPLNVVQLIALAGGVTEHAKQKQVYVLHPDGGRVNVNYKAILEGRRRGDDVALSPGDTVVVP